MNRLAFFAVLILPLGLVPVILLVLPGSVRVTASSSTCTSELRVCPTGCDYSSVQAAVDAARDGDLIKVAEGTYTDIHARPRNDITTTGIVTQVVYISKTVVIQGGYTVTDWTMPFPITQPAILDAQGQGRVISSRGTSARPLRD
jgi:pectin methylesterase-like acyl-CoA thioesterase